MALPAWLMRRLGDSAYERRIARGLEKAFGRAEERTLDRRALRAVVFSDHHRGAGDGADDFMRCEKAYRAALGWYLEQGYELWLLGDVEELWENRPRKTIERYAEVLALESVFAERGQLWRFFGNHDMAWRSGRTRKRFLGPVLGDDFPVREALRVNLMDGGEDGGTLFLVHGHQGTTDSGNLLIVPFSRFVVRVFWAALQRSRRFANTSPATDSRLRSKHDRAMFGWARARAQGEAERPVLIAGHTHHPVFPGDPPPDILKEERKRKRAWEEARDAPHPDREKVARTRAEYELIRSRRERKETSELPDDKPPCYFNTGCCSFGDGDVTGLELTPGSIKLVRWLSNTGEARPQLLAERALPELLDSLRRD